MTLEEIKAAVDAGKKVHWHNPGYTVIRDSIGQYLIHSHFGKHPCYWGLTHQDEVTLNGKPHEFYVAGEKKRPPCPTCGRGFDK